MTASNACTMSDAACAIVLTTLHQARTFGFAPLSSMMAFSETEVEPSAVDDSLGVSIRLALKWIGMTL